MAHKDYFIKASWDEFGKARRHSNDKMALDLSEYSWKVVKQAARCIANLGEDYEDHNFSIDFMIEVPSDNDE